MQLKGVLAYCCKSINELLHRNLRFPSFSSPKICLDLLSSEPDILEIDSSSIISKPSFQKTVIQFLFGAYIRSN